MRADVEAGVAKMTLYNHFASKEELIVALLEKRDRELRASIVATVEGAGKSPTKRLLAVFDWLEGWFGSADFNGDGVVNGADLGGMLASWGAVP